MNNYSPFSLDEPVPSNERVTPDKFNRSVGDINRLSVGIRPPEVDTDDEPDVPAAGDTSNKIQQFQITAINDNTLTCNPYIDGAPTTDVVTVARPYLLRCSITSRDGITFTYTGNLTRTANNGTSTETQVVVPTYIVGDVITGVQLSGGAGVSGVDWLDQNDDARAWARDGSISTTPSGPAGGDLGGPYPNPTVLSVAHVTTGTLGVANGGTGGASAGITLFNNITGYTATGATGTTSGKLVFDTSPTLVTPLLGTPASGVLTNCTGYLGDSSLVTTGTLTSGATGAGFTVALSTSTITGTLSLARLGTLSTGQIIAGNAGTATATTLGGDGTIGATGTLTVTKTNGVAFAASATTDATNATNITSGTLPAAQMPALTGDITTSAGAVATTIAANAVTNAKAAQMAASTIKGNNTGAIANAADLTVSQVKTLLAIAESDVTNLVSDLAATGNRARSVAFATTTALPANTYNNGTAGIGATLTANANGALTVDGSAVTAGQNQRILVKNEASLVKLGIYVVTQAGDASHPYILTRATDMNQSSQFQPFDAIFVEAGTANIGTIWLSQNNSPTIGTTNLQYSQFSISASTLPAFTGGDVTSSAGSAILSIGAGKVTNAMLAGSIDLTAKVTGILPIANGGTNSSSSLGNGRTIVSSGGKIVESTAPTHADSLADAIQGTSATTQKALVLQGKASQSANLFEAQDSSGNIGANITPANWFQNALGRKRVTSQFNVANSTTLAGITGLSWTLIAGRTYSFHIVLFVSVGVSAGGFKTDNNGGTATATNFICQVTSVNNSAGTLSGGTTTALNALTANAGPASFTSYTVILDGTITVNAGGTFQPEFAQNTSNATQSSVLVGSFGWLEDMP